MASASPTPLDLRDYGRMVLRRKWLIVAFTVLVVGAALGVSLREQKLYRSSAQMLMRPRAIESIFDQSRGSYFATTAQSVQTEIQVLTGEGVASLVRDKLGYGGSVSASQVGDTSVVQVSAVSPVPARAAATANAYIDAYIHFRKKQAVDDLSLAVEQVQVKVDELQKQIAPLDLQISASEQARARDADIAALRAQRDSLLSQQAVFRQSISQLQLDQSLKTGGAERVSTAGVPRVPFAPTPIRDGVRALVLGLLLGTAIVFLLEYLDDRIKTKGDLQRVIGELPVLGLIPSIAWKRKDEAVVVSMAAPRSPASEAYRTLRTSVQFLGLDSPIRLIQITSPSAEEGKSTTLTNLAVALARTGRKVLVVCCDLRRPRLHTFFDLSNDVGFTSVVVGDVPLTAAIQAIPGEPGLSLLASGPLPPNPSELLASTRAVELLKAAAAHYDYVLVDCPPLLPVTDAAIIAGISDATILVTSARKTTRKEVQRGLELLRQVEGPVVGVVLNGVVAEDTYGYGEGAYKYRYRYRYRADDGQKEKKQKRLKKQERSVPEVERPERTAV